MTKALFLDRDGTINIDYGYVHEPEKFVLIDGIIPFCKRARDLGYSIVVITNQSGIARGFFSEEDYEKLTEHMLGLFRQEGISILDVFHSPDLDGPDRKPAPGPFIKARDKHCIDMSASFNLGDKPRDIDAGLAAGVGTNVLFTGEYPASML